MASAWQQIVLDPTPANPTFVDHATALAFANEVRATATSEFRCSSVDQNPVWGWGSITSNRSFGAVQTLRTNAEPTDTRVAAKLGTATIDSLGGTRTLGILLSRNATDAVPLFTQDELTLVRAEARATWLPYPAQKVVGTPNAPTNP